MDFITKSKVADISEEFSINSYSEMVEEFKDIYHEEIHIWEDNISDIKWIKEFLKNPYSPLEENTEEEEYKEILEDLFLRKEFMDKVVEYHNKNFNYSILISLMGINDHFIIKKDGKKFNNFRNMEDNKWWIEYYFLNIISNIYLNHYSNE